MKETLCPMGIGLITNIYCSNRCEWFNNPDNGCTLKSILIEIIKLNERISDVNNSPRGGKS